ncbi:hypothetical protein SPBRAN_1977 [uncultured Candidatus Thioglobus sp.]|nr:hypothetical protein SPBRAN_1977 [uncultured Candidatus Thioglobus sp.]
MTDFCQIGDFIKASPSLASASFNKITKLVKGGILMIIPYLCKDLSFKRSIF